MTTDSPAAEGRERADFIREIVAADLAAGRHGRRSSPASRPSRTATSTSATPSRSASTSASPASSAAAATSASTTRTRPRRSRSTSTSIQDDVRWLGFDWGEHLYFASDYFEQLYEWAEHLIRNGQGLRRRPLAGRDPRATAARSPSPGRESPYRNRSVEENLDLFRRMRAGEFPDGARVLRAKIDMASAQHQPARPGALPDPPRARTPAPATRGASTRCTTSPTPVEDAIEGITHSICTLEFEDHRPLYDWFLENLPRAVAPAPDRVRPAQPHLHRDEQAQAAAARRTRGACAAGTTRACRRSPGMRRRGYTARGDPRLRASDRRRQARQHRRHRAARALRPRRPQPTRAARAWPCCARSRS